jgi:iron(III) transport system substrate-binding protein
MQGLPLSRRSALAGLAAAGVLVRLGPARAAKPYDPPGSLIDAAKKEGRMVLYTASFTEVEQETVAVFNKRFPFVRVEIVRASGGQLITRVRTELAAGKLVADVIDHSDRSLMKPIEDAFIDYAPPNAADYLPSSLFSPKYWPRITPGWCIAYQTELTKNPPKSWMDLTKPEYADGQIGQVIAQSGGTTFTRVLFERAVLGADYWAKQAAIKPRLYVSGAPASDSLVRGEVSIAPLIRNIVFPKKEDGAPVEIFFPPEGVPIVPYATGIPKTAFNPNAARLYMDWSLSDEGQVHSITKQGNLTSLANPPTLPDGFDPKVTKVWVPSVDTMIAEYEPVIAEWNKIYGYR